MPGASSHLLHFPSAHAREAADDDGLEAALAILAAGVIPRGSGTFGAARKVREVTASQRATCFFELGAGTELGRRHGIAFTKAFLRSRGAEAVWHVEYGSAVDRAVKRLIDDAAQAEDFSAPIWTISPFVDAVLEDAVLESRAGEWRLTAELAFEPHDVAFLLFPKSSHEAARAFLAKHSRWPTSLQIQSLVDATNVAKSGHAGQR